MKSRRVIRLGVIADTHGLYDPVIETHFRSVDRIIHAGDIGKPAVLDRLAALAPVTAVSGNVDGYENSGFPVQRLMRVAGRRIAVRHILFERGKLTQDARKFLEDHKPDICIFGHTHQPVKTWVDTTLLVNPGSAGPRRFSLPRGVGLLVLSAAGVKVRLIALPDRAASQSLRKGG